MSRYVSWFDSPLPCGLYYNQAHEAWRSTIRSFVDEEILPHVEDWEEQGTFPRELYGKAAEIGFLRMGYPEELGGIEMPDPFFGIVAHQEMARHASGGLNASLSSHNIGLPPVAAHAGQALRERIVPEVLAGEKISALAITEPSGGSDVAQLRTRAAVDGDDYIVDGSKMFITSGMRADYITTAVRTSDAPGARGISLLLIEADAEGVSRTELSKMGWWCSDTAAIYFDGVRVPRSHLIGPENEGFSLIMRNFNSERLMMAAQSLGACRVCLDAAVSWAQQRETFGRRLAEHQVIRHKIAQMVQRIQATDAYLLQTAWRLHSEEAPPVVDLSLLKVQATEAMEFCAREAMQILGGAGYMRGHPVERIYREVRVSAIGGGSEEIMRDLAARQLGL
ncbi:MAG: acyl-CoA dehydrogenase family protein [Gammaproteobacteria bacterium AqS3]|nr:acyl-CoA dehydrogenase family protein [Gammaproteobacteria bacterium AqS3]